MQIRMFGHYAVCHPNLAAMMTKALKRDYYPRTVAARNKKAVRTVIAARARV